MLVIRAKEIHKNIPGFAPKGIASARPNKVNAKIPVPNPRDVILIHTGISDFRTSPAIQKIPIRIAIYAINPGIPSSAAVWRN